MHCSEERYTVAITKADMHNPGFLVSMEPLHDDTDDHFLLH